MYTIIEFLDRMSHKLFDDYIYEERWNWGPLAVMQEKLCNLLDRYYV